MASWHAGLDRAGTPAPADIAEGHQFFVTIIAALNLEGERADAFTDQLASLRKEMGWPAQKEFHANEALEEQTLKFLRICSAFDLRVGCLVLDKRQITDMAIKPAQVMSRTTEMLGTAFFQRYCVAELRCDQDTKGHLQKEERTLLKRLYRAACSEAKLVLGPPDSRHSPLVQSADAVAYMVRRYYTEKLETSHARRFIEE